ncbi:vegetative incompatibility het-e-1 [Fusarium sporotrichioides]|uniref:Vegetative incompatibility het-e-1 n=1 Tax=Fusarium sporotrichioides TaxID=5514 RepID=A0A395RVD7_FUSSP|nr:vegetative incompatibility het-e-1 [Fusarium sporotrichioides]
MSLLIEIDKLIKDAGDIDPLAAFDHIWKEMEEEYQELVDDITLFLNNECKENNVRATISGRVKSIDSIKHSISRRKMQGERYETLQDIFAGIHDLAGFRIVPDYPSGISTAEQIITQQFDTVKVSNFSSDLDLGLDWKPIFGAFASTNHRVKVRDVPLPRRYRGIMVEVQVLSLAESLYNKLAHDLIYKDTAGELSTQDQKMIDISHVLSLCYWVCLSSMEDKLEQNPKIPQAVRKAKGVADFPNLVQATPDLKSPSGRIPISTLLRFLEDYQTNGAMSDNDLRDQLKQVAGREAQVINHHSGSGHNINQFAPTTNHFGPSTSYHYASDPKTTDEIRNETSTNQSQRTDDQNDACMRELRGLTVDSRDVAKSIEGRKEPLFPGAFEWVLHTEQHRAFSNCDINQAKPARLLWIRGGPGLGKTMLILGIWRWMMAGLKEDSTNKKSVLSLFFAQTTGPEYNNATAILRGLVWLLARQRPQLISHLRNEYDGCGSSLFTDGNAFFALSRILKAMVEDTMLQRVVLVVDALDECEENLPQLTELFADILGNCSRVQILISSRPLDLAAEYPIRNLDTGVKILDLDSIPMEQAVNSYIDYRITELAKRKERFPPDLQTIIKQSLKDNAGATFLWVALVCKLLEQNKTRNYPRIVDSTPKDLVKVYDKMFTQIVTDDFSNPDEYKSVFSVATVAIGAVSLVELACLLRLPIDELEDIIDDCGPLLLVREKKLYFVHQTAKEFVSERLWAGNISLGHSCMAQKALDVMLSDLSKNICGMKQYDAPPPDEGSEDAKALGRLRYACFHWIDHLFYSKGEAQTLLQLVESVLNKRFLNWIEFLSFLKSYGIGVVALETLISILKTIATKMVPDLEAFVMDAQRFLRLHRPSIELFPRQTYVSALIFSPKNSIIRQTFQHELPNFIVQPPMLVDDWDAAGQDILWKHFNPSSARFPYGEIEKMIFSPCQNLLACICCFEEFEYSEDEVGMEWHVVVARLNGVVEYTCQHSQSVLSVAFQPSGNIVSTTATMVFKWDKQGRLETSYKLPGINCSMKNCEMVIVNDKQILCSAVDGDTLGLWSLQGTEEKLRSYDLGQLCGGQGPYKHLLLSDGRIVIWHRCIDVEYAWQDLENGVVFDPSTGTFDIRILDQSGQSLVSLQGHQAPIIDVSCTREGLISSLAADGIVIAWNPQGKPKHTTNCGKGVVGVCMLSYNAVVTLHYYNTGSFKRANEICLWSLGLDENWTRRYNLKTLAFLSDRADLTTLSYPENSDWPLLGIRFDDRVMIIDTNLFAPAACKVSYCIPAFQAPGVMQVLQDDKVKMVNLRKRNTETLSLACDHITIDPRIHGQVSPDGSRLCFVETGDSRHYLHVFDSFSSQRLHMFSADLAKSSFAEHWNRSRPTIAFWHGEPPEVSYERNWVREE